MQLNMASGVRKMQIANDLWPQISYMPLGYGT